jgi:ABC-type uncharacterized transport system permease subunit
MAEHHLGSSTDETVTSPIDRNAPAQISLWAGLLEFSLLYFSSWADHTQSHTCLLQSISSQFAGRWPLSLALLDLRETVGLLEVLLNQLLD